MGTREDTLKAPTLGAADILTQQPRWAPVNPAAPPYFHICRIDIAFSSGDRGAGTGWLAGPHLVLTAGHCVLDKAGGGGFADRMWLSFPNAVIEVDHPASFLTTPRWASSSDLAWDLGGVLLPRQVGSRLTPWSIPDPAAMIGAKVEIAGYPLVGGGNLLSHAGKIVGNVGRRMFYDIDVDQGQSGSPILWSGASGVPVSIGIHNANSSFSVGLARPANGGVLFDAAVAECIADWLRR